MLLGGIDEAGRGSVIGPLVIAGISFNPTGIESLRNQGITDSKMLTVQKREILYPKIKNFCNLFLFYYIACV